jgi:predicted DsbA family dithiol-disulfide isomerase
MTKNKDPLIELIVYTDPYCTWCWGSEPALRKIEEGYGSLIRIKNQMGGLVEDISTFYDPSNLIGGPNWYKQVAMHWLEASKKHGMPVDEHVFYEVKDEMRSTYPASIAYKAVESLDEEKAKRFLRRMREGASAERLPIHRVDVQADLAEEVGVDREKFISEIKSGEAEKSFYEDLSEARSRGITGFPTFLIRNKDGDEITLHGFQSFETFKRAFQKLGGDDLKPNLAEPSQENILNFIRKYGKVARREIAELFDLPKESVRESLNQLIDSGSVKEVKAGNGFFYLPSIN